MGLMLGVQMTPIVKVKNKTSVIFQIGGTSKAILANASIYYVRQISWRGRGGIYITMYYLY